MPYKSGLNIQAAKLQGGNECLACCLWDLFLFLNSGKPLEVDRVLSQLRRYCSQHNRIKRERLRRTWWFCLLRNRALLLIFPAC